MPIAAPAGSHQQGAIRHNLQLQCINSDASRNRQTLSAARKRLHTARNKISNNWTFRSPGRHRQAGAQGLATPATPPPLTPTTDLLNDRGMMGDGAIDIPLIRSWVEGQGFAGFSEVEIFSTGNWWQQPGEQTLATCIQRHKSAV